MHSRRHVSFPVCIASGLHWATNNGRCLALLMDEGFLALEA
jgi:hypothetical protein